MNKTYKPLLKMPLFYVLISVIVLWLACFITIWSAVVLGWIRINKEIIAFGNEYGVETTTPSEKVSGPYFEDLDATNQERAIRQMAWLGTAGYDDLEQAGYNYWPIRFRTDSALALASIGGRVLLVPIELTSDGKALDATPDKTLFDTKKGSPLSPLQAEVFRRAGWIIEAGEREREINLGQDIVDRFRSPGYTPEILDDQMAKVAKKLGADDDYWSTETPFLSEDLQCLHYYYFATVSGSPDPAKYDWKSVVCLHVFSKGFFLQTEEELDYFTTTFFTRLREVGYDYLTATEMHDLITELKKDPQ